MFDLEKAQSQVAAMEAEWKSPPVGAMKECNSQHEYAKENWPSYETNSEGYVLQKPAERNWIDRLFKTKIRLPSFGPVSHRAYMNNLCRVAFMQWPGRTEQINQYDFQVSEVKAGRMLPPRDHWGNLEAGF